MHYQQLQMQHSSQTMFLAQHRRRPKPPATTTTAAAAAATTTTSSGRTAETGYGMKPGGLTSFQTTAGWTGLGHINGCL